MGSILIVTLLGCAASLDPLDIMAACSESVGSLPVRTRPTVGRACWGEPPMSRLYGAKYVQMPFQYIL